MPLPKSAAAAARCTPLGASSPTTGRRSRNQALAGPGRSPPPSTKRTSTPVRWNAGWSSSPEKPNGSTSPSSGPGSRNVAWPSPVGRSVPAHGDRVGPHDLDLEVAGAERDRDAEHPPPRPGHGDVDRQRLEGDRPHELERQPGDGELGAGRALDRAGHQGRDRTAVLVARVPRPPGVLGGDIVGARVACTAALRTSAETNGRSPLRENAGGGQMSHAAAAPRRARVSLRRPSRSP
jgi:hypothetical protein